MLVYFLRHAEAEDDAGSDFDRRLTAKGLGQADKVGKFCARYGLVPDLILSSPVVRADQTARAVAAKLGGVEVVEARWAACGMSPGACLDELGAFKNFGSVMLVGHEPDFSEAVASLAGIADPECIKVRKASLTCVEALVLRPGGGRIHFSVPVRLM